MSDQSQPFSHDSDLTPTPTSSEGHGAAHTGQEPCATGLQYVWLPWEIHGSLYVLDHLARFYAYSLN